MPRWLVFFTTLCFVFVFPQKAYAKMLSTAYIFDVEHERWQGLLLLAPTPKALFEKLGLDVHSAALCAGTLTLDVGADITLYGGGAYTERVLVQKLMHTAFGIPHVTHFRLLIDGEARLLPEGTLIDEEKPPT
jgi:hypothetical protein